MSNLELKLVSYEDAKAAIQFIRQVVFQQEQSVDPAVDFDGLDEIATHIVAYKTERPIATARLRQLSDRTLKLERMAVLAAYRGQGIGREMVKLAIAEGDRQNAPQLKLNAQIQAQPFYEKLGFAPYGEEFEDAGIRHIEMRRSSNQR
ncbi:GNAT family N-acetyltransferase [Phormidium tenue FACHB-886]|nr:GNAT family N-acetyltransferase [Phormidium tenue FACHB-886]